MGFPFDIQNHLFSMIQDHTTRVLVELFIIYLTAKLLAEVFEWLKQPPIVGEIIAGILLGPGVLNIVAPNDTLTLLAEIGVIFLLFTVGLVTRPSDLFRVGKTAILVAVLGVIIPFLLGWAVYALFAQRLLGSHSTIEAIFISAAMVATSVGITSRVLGDLGVIDAVTSRIILGAAVIDDILGLLVMAVVSSLARGRVNYVSLAVTSLIAIGFVAFLVFVGSRWVNRLSPQLNRLRSRESHFMIAIILCLGLSVVSAFIGMAAIIGAFLAGVMLAETSKGTRMLQQSEALMEFLLPFFLVDIGLHLEFKVFLSPGVIIMALIITSAAIVGKLVGCGTAAMRQGWRGLTQVGVGMVPRGEVGIIVAQMGLGLHSISSAMYGAVLFMAVATTLVAPPYLRLLYRGSPEAALAKPSEDRPVRFK